MASRWRFILAQFLWVVLAIGLLVTTGQNVPAAVIAPIGLMFVVTGFLMQWGGGNQESATNDNTVMKALVTSFMWLIYVGAVMGGLMSVGALIIPLAFIFMIPLLALSAFMWDFFGKVRELRLAEQGHDVDTVEKRKRDRLDAVLRDLSDRDLVRLKQRLAHRMIDDEDIQLMLDDDGELVPVEKSRR